MNRKIIKFSLVLMLAHLGTLAADLQKILHDQPKNKEEQDVVTALVKVFPKTTITSLNQISLANLLPVNKNLVICIDLDSTLLTYRYKFKHYTKEVVDGFIAGFLPKARSCTQLQLASFLQWLCDHPATFECELLESDSLSWLQQMEKLAICSFALTARKRCIKDQTKNNLIQLGANFGKWSHMSHGNWVPIGAKFQGVELSDGVIFTGNSVKKADIMDALAHMVAKEFDVTAPFTIVHIDDSLDEINAHFENKVGTCSMIPWSVLPIHFKGLDEHLKSLASNEMAYGKLWQEQILQLYDVFVLLTLH